MSPEDRKQFTKWIILGIFVFIIVIVLSILAEASIVGVNVLNISNCYNFTAEVELIEGNDSNVYPRDCSKISSNTWFCKCNNLDNAPYQVWIQREDKFLREASEYKITLDVKHYEFNNDRFRFKFDNWGDYVETSDLTNKSLGDDFKTRYIDRIIEVNISIPVYVNDTRYIEVPVHQDRFLYNCSETVREVNVSVPIYYENETRIKELERESNIAWLYYLIAGIIAATISSLLTYYRVIRMKVKGT